MYIGELVNNNEIDLGTDFIIRCYDTEHLIVSDVYNSESEEEIPYDICCKVITYIGTTIINYKSVLLIEYSI